jgi:N-acetylneuraminate synthase/N,N'-diacetyllegionaminate synthase
MEDSQLWFREADERGPARVGLIAEIGVNHDGDVDRGRMLIEVAKACGVDAIKLQLFNPDRLLSDASLLAGYQEGKAEDAKALLRGLALEPGDMDRLGERARSLGLKLVVTPFSPGDVPVLADLGVDAVKIASPDAVNAPLLEAVAELGKPLLISTGTCTPDELVPAADLLSGHGPGGCLLQCVSSYPTPTEDAALGGVHALREHFALPTGYSDHTREVTTGALAVAAGACLIEKHLTYDRSAEGPDHAASADPDQFAEYVRQVRRAQAMLGPMAKRVLDVERDVREVSRQSVALVRDLPAGHRLTRHDLTVMRPGTGIPASDLETLVDKTLKNAVKARRLLSLDDLADAAGASAA